MHAVDNCGPWSSFYEGSSNKITDNGNTIKKLPCSHGDSYFLIRQEE